MRSLPPRWRPLVEYIDVLLSPLLEAGAGGWFLVEAGGPDGERWTSIQPIAVPLGREDPALAVARVVSLMCGATRDRPEPEVERQRRRGVYYVPASFLAPKRLDQHVGALGAVVLDIDDRDHGGREGVLAAVARVPTPTAVVTSGGGVQVAFVLREAIVFDRRDEAALTEAVRGYVRVALALQEITGADDTAWPGHLFRCPQTYHLKDPSRPVLVTVELDPSRRFNLSDFDSLVGAADAGRVEAATARIVARLLGRKPPSASLDRLVPLAEAAGADGKKPRVVLPRRVSPAIVRLLNEGTHPKYLRGDGTLDRSRAVYAVALSLLAAGLDEDRVASILAASALRPAIDDRGDDALRWLGFQIRAAREYLAKAAEKRRGA